MLPSWDKGLQRFVDLFDGVRPLRDRVEHLPLPAREVVGAERLVEGLFE
ncbi:hypothetical protein [Amycolatopsis sp. DSM 110486]|nr:hypothetical protein [Amycolatopsis sp. DSM 110486]